MKLMIYGIGGRLEAGASGDCLVGIAHDTTTYRSLLELVGLMGGYAVSLHGTFDGYHEDMMDEDIINPISGEYSLPDALALLPLPKQA